METLARQASRHHLQYVLMPRTTLTLDPDVASALARYLRHDDPLLRAHAVWAARRLGREDLLDGLRDEDDPLVLVELAAPSP